MVSKDRSREKPRKRGFAAMDPEARRAISKRGGEASHESGRGHEFNSEEAREAGRLGGEARWGNRAGRQDVRQEEIGRSIFRSGSTESELLEGDLERRGSSSLNSGERHDIARREPWDGDAEGPVAAPRSGDAPRERVARGRQGFASMDPKQQRDIARRGGEASGRARGSRAR
jgi:general stress protein YciG